VSQLADIYSLGALLHALLTGRPPAMHRSKSAASEALPVAATLPAPLRRLCNKCLAFDQAHRFQSASQLLSELASVRASHPEGGLRFTSKTPR